MIAQAWDENGKVTKNPVEQVQKSSVIQVIHDIENLFTTKQKEYKGKSTDTYRNFNQGAQLQNETPEQTLLGYANKQVVSLYDAKHLNPERLQDYAFVKEKAMDIIVYLTILIAMVKDNHTEYKDIPYV